MLEAAFGRLLSGALWGVGAGVAMVVLRSGEPGLRPLAKSAVRAYVAVSERVEELTAEARESVEDLYAEAKAEQQREMARPVEE